MSGLRILALNGDMSANSALMDAVRRFHALCSSRGLTYCVVGGAAVIRNGYPRTTADIDILTRKDEWMKLLPIEGEIHSIGIDACTDSRTGLTIDILFAEDDWEMPTPMPDPASVGEFDEKYGANYIGLHALVQLKAAVYLSKRHAHGENVASKDRSDVFELIRRNLPQFTRARIQTYHPAVRKHCLKAFEDAVRTERGQPSG
jgi:hypothetical protein